MTNTIIHHKNVPLTHSDRELNGAAQVCMFDHGNVIVSMSASCGAAHMSLHIDADSLIALAKLLNEAVEKLPVPVEEAA